MQKPALVPAFLASAALAASCSHASSGPPAGSSGPFGSGVAVSSNVELSNLTGPVDAVRDTHGMIHIYATSVPDALRVEGYQMARDRTAQVEIVRRYAEGKMAELFGDAEPSLIDGDITMRTLGLERVAQAMYAQLTPDDEVKSWLDAFADGISQFNARLQTGEESLPSAMIGIPTSAFGPWTGVDALAVARLEEQQLAYTGDSEVAQTSFAQAARGVFSATSTDPLLAKRAGFLRDMIRFAPLDPTLAMDGGFPNDTALADSLPAHPPGGGGARLATPRIPDALLAGAAAWREASARVHRVFGKEGSTGSNNWVVGPSRTATGHVMVASDPHLLLSAPAIFWMVQIDATAPPGGDSSKDVHVAGLAFPGIPGIILGFNGNVAWGATTADYDVTDVYQEKLTPDGGSVVFNGANVPLQTVDEVIKIAGGTEVDYKVLVVPQHGPIIPTIVNHQVVAPVPSQGALSLKWTGFSPTNELGAVAGFLRAKTVEDFRTAIRNFGVGAQNWVVGDTSGNIFYTTQSLIPKRDKRAYTWSPSTFSGTLPCFVLPGDGTAEWTGSFLEEAYVPHVKNPPKAYVGTANGDQVGDTLTNDPSSAVLPDGQPMYMACYHDPGFRVGRIHQKIEQLGHPMALDDMAQIQADARSALGANLAPKLLAALADAQAEAATPGSHPDLTALVGSARYKAAPIATIVSTLSGWAAADYDANVGLSLDDGSPSLDPTASASSEATSILGAWLVRMMELVYDDELNKLGMYDPPVDLRIDLMYLMTTDPTQLATYDPTTKDSALFDDLTTPAVETRDQDAVTALLDAVDYLTTKLGGDPSSWRWGKIHTLTFASLVPLWSSLSIPNAGDAVFPTGFPRHGDGFDIDVAGYDNYRPDKLADMDWSYSEGPTQRFVVDLDPAGPTVNNVLPGGEVWDNASPHFRDEAELWRRNQNHAIPYQHADVASGAEERIQYGP